MQSCSSNARVIDCIMPAYPYAALPLAISRHKRACCVHQVMWLSRAGVEVARKLRRDPFNTAIPTAIVYRVSKASDMGM